MAAFQRPDPKAFLLPALIDWHAERNGSHPFQLNLIDGEWRTTTHADFAKLVAGAAVALSGDDFKLPLRRAGDVDEPPYVTVLAGSDVTSLAVYIGLMRRGCATFPVTPRAGADAIVAMLGKLKCQHLLYTPQHAKLAEAVQTLLKEQGDASQQLVTFALTPTTEAIASATEACKGNFPYDFKHKDEANKPCIVFTTSGSTGFPKVCPYSHRHMLLSGQAVNPTLLRDSGIEVQYDDERMLVPPPLFHFMGWGMGVLACILGPITKVTPPPGPPPNASTLIELIRTHKCQQALLVPSQLDELSLDKAAIETLAGLRRVWYGGAPLSKTTMDRLHAAGVRLCTAYGSTDIGAVGMTPQDIPLSEEGVWMALREDFDYEFDPVSVDEHGTQLYELVVKAGKEIGPILEHEPGINRSGDLCALHPTRKHNINLRGRRGDLVILNNGENVATLPFEHAATSHPSVSHAMVFGHGRPQAGILIQLRSSHTDKTVDEVREALMPTLEAVNAKSPDFAKIFPNMIVVATPEKPFFVSDKNSIQTGRTLALYAGEIEAAYNEDTDKPAAASLTSLKREELQRFLYDSVLRVLDVDAAKLSASTPLQDAGMDSLRATMIRRSVVAGLKEAQAVGLAGENGAKLDLNINSLSSSFAFDGATVDALTNILHVFVNGGSTKVDTIEEQVELAEALLAKYALKPISDRAASKPQVNGVSGLTVLLTGTTGGLGCALLEFLERDERVARIICHNRAASASADGTVLAGKERQADALKRRGLSLEVANSSKLVFIDGSDVELKRNQLPEKVDIVLHSAWPVRFDLPLSSFDNSIAGAHNLLELSRELGAKFVFISSVGTVMGAAAVRCKAGEKTYKVAETERAEFQYAMGGYGSSKSVVERLISSAVHTTSGFEAFSIRSGQLMGDERTGSWNAHEWWPRIVRSAPAIGLLPDSIQLGALDWLTINDAAQAILDMTLAPRGALKAATSASTHNVVNFIHPKTIKSAAEIFQFLVEGSTPKIVSLDEWLVALRKLQDSQEAKDDFAALVEKVPALSLMDTYEGMASAPTTLLEAGEVTPFLANAKVLDAELAAKFMQYWAAAGKDSTSKNKA